MLDLAAHLGMSVSQMSRSMSVKEFSLWRIKFHVDPWGERRADLRFAQLMALYANAHLPEGKPRLSPDDFMPKFGVDEDDEGSASAANDEVFDDDEDAGATVAPETIAYLRARAAQTEREKANDDH